MSLPMPVEKIDIPKALEECANIATGVVITVQFEIVKGVGTVGWCVSGVTGQGRPVICKGISLRHAVENFKAAVGIVAKIESESFYFKQSAEEIRDALKGDIGDAHDYAMAARDVGIDWQYGK